MRQPGKDPRQSLLEVALAFILMVGLGGLGCGTGGARARRVPASVFHGSKLRGDGGKRLRSLDRPASAVRPGHESAAFVAAALHRRGLRFGTDGTTGALWGYLSQSHALVAPGAARPGDVLFFDTRAGAGEAACANHAALVERVEPDGRIVFAEVRDGTFRKSVVDPARPALRRNEQGEIANSFLRPKTIDDPPDARYLAGELLCGVARTTPTK